MAHGNKGLIAGKLQGTVNKELVFRQWDGKTVVAKAVVDKDGDATPAQLQVQRKFLRASRYAKSVAKGANQSIKDAYKAALRPRQNVYSRALEDFLNPPVVESINTRTYRGVIGNTFTIGAVDDFRITRVEVEIYSADGTLLETGDAVQIDDSEYFNYTVTVANPTLAGTRIKAIATDVPRNEGTLETIL